ncbi:hypothetical protein AAFF_G00049120 [Aldrovandia affinis]|uniref:Uncharacterized protein n=1 Tax=Aldrovandia affinis TaxID=143900 RepID=A0AAD7WEJ8_9TELE|nr:hypothetical protein AAFF_G00049120 [Aldrovandia affinis]
MSSMASPLDSIRSCYTAWHVAVVCQSWETEITSADFRRDCCCYVARGVEVNGAGLEEGWLPLCRTGGAEVKRGSVAILRSPQGDREPVCSTPTFSSEVNVNLTKRLDKYRRVLALLILFTRGKPLLATERELNLSDVREDQTWGYAMSVRDVVRHSPAFREKIRRRGVCVGA